VSLYADAGPVGTASSPPYQWTWQSASVADGVHRLTVLGGDTSGNSASAFVDVLVSNAPPVSPRVTFAAWDTDHAWVEIVFSKPMNRTSVETNLQTTPITEHSLSWANDTHLFIVLTGTWSQGQRHVVTIDAAATDLEGVTMSNGFTYEFQSSQRASSEFPWSLINIALVAGVVLTLAAFLRTRRRRGIATRAASAQM